MTRQLAVTGARVTQLMDLLVLAPEVQAEILLVELPPAPNHWASAACVRRCSARSTR